MNISKHCKNRVITCLAFSACFIVSCNKASDDPQGYDWPSSDPHESGMNSLILDSAYIKAERLGFVDGLVVIRNGKLVSEGYYNGYTRATPHQIWSCTKSFVSALVGIALEQGLIESTEKKIMDYFPDYVYAGMDPRFHDITVGHLLTMRMGIDKEENNLIPVVSTDDWLNGTFHLPLIFDPGQKFSYNSLETHLLSAIITRVSGQSALDFARANLTDPLGIEIDQWNHDYFGYNTGGYDIFMKPRDMAVLGYLYLHEGYARGRQIVPKAWISASIIKTWANNGTEWGPLTDYNYGYLWWLGKIGGYEMFMAMGMGGQYIITFPGLDLVVVATSNKDISWDNEQEIPVLEIISEYILKSLN